MYKGNPVQMQRGLNQSFMQRILNTMALDANALESTALHQNLSKAVSGRCHVITDVITENGTRIPLESHMIQSAIISVTPLSFKGE